MGDLKSVAERFYGEVMNGGDLDAFDEIVDDSFIEHEEFPGLTANKEGVRTWLSMMRDAFPDFSVDVDAMVSEGDEVWTQGTMRGTHKGEFMGIPATGKAVEVAVLDRVRFRDGKAVEHWGVTDSLAMMQQLGVIPEEP